MSRGKTTRFNTGPPCRLGNRDRAIGRENLRQAYEAGKGEGLMGHNDSSGVGLTLRRYSAERPSNVKHVGRSHKAL